MRTSVVDGEGMLLSGTALVVDVTGASNTDTPGPLVVVGRELGVPAPLGLGFFGAVVGDAANSVGVSVALSAIVVVPRTSTGGNLGIVLFVLFVLVVGTAVFGTVWLIDWLERAACA
ncbi:MAG: hypothetical protein WD029_09940 [Microthrixaceae bacterium]